MAVHHCRRLWNRSQLDYLNTSDHLGLLCYLSWYRVLVLNSPGGAEPNEPGNFENLPGRTLYVPKA